MPDQKVFMNTVDKGVLYFDLRELEEDKAQLELSDFKSFDHLHIDEGFSVSMLFCWPPWKMLSV